MNLAILVGEISSDIVKRDIRNGGTVTKFRLKTFESMRTDGDVRERSQTHLIDVFNPYIQREITPLLRKGQMVEIHGSIESRKVSRDGEPDRWSTSIVVGPGGRVGAFGGRTLVSAVSGDEDREPTIDHSGGRNGPTAKPDAERAPAYADGFDEDVPF